MNRNARPHFVLNCCYQTRLIALLRHNVRVYEEDGQLCRALSVYVYQDLKKGEENTGDEDIICKSAAERSTGLDGLRAKIKNRKNRSWE